MPADIDYSLSIESSLRNNLLVYMYNYMPVLSCIPSSRSLNDFRRLSKDHALFTPDIVARLGERDSAEDKCYFMWSALGRLAELEFVQRIYTLGVEQRDSTESNEDNIEEYDHKRIIDFFGPDAINGLPRWLAQQTESYEDTKFDLKPTAGSSPKHQTAACRDNYNIKGITYRLTNKGYEVAMSLAVHNDSEAVRLASISSAKTAGRAFWAAIAIAVGSVGGLILKACEMFCPYF